MARKALAVIGANYGDEGKGAVTDALVRRHGISVVARHNGGAQAGHTVINAGRRHVFHHFGSGTFGGASTFLTSKFIVNPILFNGEFTELQSFGLNPEVRVSPNAIVTTPYDMILNQAAELSRDGGRHGSCGVGINETVTRSTQYGRLTVIDLLDQSTSLIATTSSIRHHWLPARMDALNLSPGARAWVKEFLQKHQYIDNKFYAECVEFLNRVSVMLTPPSIQLCLFEGAQGLALDEVHGDFPHVTRSRTGLNNVRLELSTHFSHDVTHLEAWYVTRPYLTRHGAGPLPNELPGLPSFADAVDLTNVPNDFQGSIRYGLLDVDALGERIRRDFLGNDGDPVHINPCIAVTCLDQLRGYADVIVRGSVTRVSAENLPAFIGDRLRQTFKLPITHDGVAVFTQERSEPPCLLTSV